MVETFKKTSAKDQLFWKRKALGEMTKEEWEAVCDGCGRCCLNKLEEKTTGEIFHTDVACRLLDPETCRCTNYENRKKFVPECQILTSWNLNKYSWLPSTCAYRLLQEGRELFWWHPLVSGNPQSVHDAGISVQNRVVSERECDDLENHVVSWPA